MIARTKSYVFKEIFLAVFPLGPLLACAVNVLNNMVFKTIEQLKTTLSLENIVENIASEDITEMMSLFVWILLSCNLFVIRYYLLTEDCRKA